MQDPKRMVKHAGRTEMKSHQGTATKQQSVATLPQEFAERLRERSAGAPTHSDFLHVIGEFIVVRNGKVDESDPRTKVAREVILLLKESRDGSRKFFSAHSK